MPSRSLVIRLILLFVGVTLGNPGPLAPEEATALRDLCLELKFGNGTPVWPDCSTSAIRMACNTNPKLFGVTACDSDVPSNTTFVSGLSAPLKLQLHLLYLNMYSFCRELPNLTIAGTLPDSFGNFSRLYYLYLNSFRQCRLLGDMRISEWQ
jgi:hypothetical protein